MDLDNINDIETLRNAAKLGRVKLDNDVKSECGNYTFRKGFWYKVAQDEYYVYIFSETYTYKKMLSYKDASQYLSHDN